MSVNEEELKKTKDDVNKLKKQLTQYEDKFKDLQKLNASQKEEIDTLNAKNDYLQSLITKLDRR